MPVCTDALTSIIDSTTTPLTTWIDAEIPKINAITDATIMNDEEQKVAEVFACLQEKLNTVSTVSTQITHLYETQLALEKENTAKEEAVQIAKDRVALLTHPERNTTVHESIFPIKRPLQTGTLLLLLVFGLFFISISTGLLMRFLGIGLNIEMQIPGSIMKPPILRR